MVRGVKIMFDPKCRALVGQVKWVLLSLLMLCGMPNQQTMFLISVLATVLASAFLQAKTSVHLKKKKSTFTRTYSLSQHFGICKVYFSGLQMVPIVGGWATWRIFTGFSGLWCNVTHLWQVCSQTAAVHGVNQCWFIVATIPPLLMWDMPCAARASWGSRESRATARPSQEHYNPAIRTQPADNQADRSDNLNKTNKKNSSNKPYISNNLPSFSTFYSFLVLFFNTFFSPYTLVKWTF